MINICKGEEITIDYRLNAFDDTSTSSCAGNSPKCTRNVTWTAGDSGVRTLRETPVDP